MGFLPGALEVFTHSHSARHKFRLLQAIWRKPKECENEKMDFEANWAGDSVRTRQCVSQPTGLGGRLSFAQLRGSPCVRCGVETCLAGGGRLQRRRQA